VAPGRGDDGQQQRCGEFRGRESSLCRDETLEEAPRDRQEREPPERVRQTQGDPVIGVQDPRQAGEHEQRRAAVPVLGSNWVPLVEVPVQVGRLQDLRQAVDVGAAQHDTQVVEVV
jgi:hypothetical protein